MMKFTRSLNAGARRDYFLPERKSDQDNEDNQQAAAMRGPAGILRLTPYPHSPAPEAPPPLTALLKDRLGIFQKMPSLIRSRFPSHSGASQVTMP